MVVSVMRSVRVIDGGEDRDGAWRTAKPRQILRKMELGGRAWRGESLSSVAWAFHRTPCVHRRWARAPPSPLPLGQKKQSSVLCSYARGYIRNLIGPGWWHEPGLKGSLWSRFKPPTGTNGGGPGARPIVLEICPRGNNKCIIIIFLWSW